MTARLVFNHRENWLLPGSPGDSRLAHSDPSDQVLIYPSYVGQGYRQKIQLREDITLVIMDYVLKRDLVFDVSEETACSKFEFPLVDAETQHSTFVPVLGFRMVKTPIIRKRVFEIEVIFKRASMLAYAQDYFERLPTPTQRIVEGIVKSLWRFQGGYPGLGMAEMLNRLLAYSVKGSLTSYAGVTFGHLLPEALYAETVDLEYVNRRPMTSAMKKTIGQILTCPYYGATRRAYLERKALELVALRLQAIAQPRLHETDLNCIYHAASILRSQYVNPPTVEALARNVGTNRLKLNQGFHEVYGTTPFNYLRACRMGQARRLLMTSEMSVESIAAAVGYSSRNHFAKVFRRQAGLNPKAFQMQVWQCAS
ncbi:MAG: helix-turn-helix transcriptional regulator [Leptolyngbya sp. SIO1E4]|nr:helix-turn-helix transcriptional regulator [Leptolyngbya sp. SIO1E4]